jgi:hypothetical protein
VVAARGRDEEFLKDGAPMSLPPSDQAFRTEDMQKNIGRKTHEQARGN